MHILSARTQGHRQPTYARKPVSIQLRCALAGRGRSQIEGLNRNRKSKVDGWADWHDYFKSPRPWGNFQSFLLTSRRGIWNLLLIFLIIQHMEMLDIILITFKQGCFRTRKIGSPTSTPILARVSPIHVQIEPIYMYLRYKLQSRYILYSPTRRRARPCDL